MATSVVLGGHSSGHVIDQHVMDRLRQLSHDRERVSVVFVFHGRSSTSTGVLDGVVDFNSIHLQKDADKGSKNEQLPLIGLNLAVRTITTEAGEVVYSNPSIGESLKISGVGHSRELRIASFGAQIVEAQEAELAAHRQPEPEGRKSLGSQVRSLARSLRSK